MVVKNSFVFEQEHNEIPNEMRLYVILFERLEDIGGSKDFSYRM